MVLNIVQTGNTHPDFKKLTRLLDSELNARYGKLQGQYDVHNKIVPIPTAFVMLAEKTPVGCGCFKVLDETIIEIKRMFVKKEYRGRGFSKQLLATLETRAREAGYTIARLETGKGQPEAIGLYQACGYERIDNFGPYKAMENSVCFEKQIGKQ